MMNIIESHDDEFIKNNDIKLSAKDKLYILRLNNINIGYGIIRNSINSNRIYIQIFDEFQSNGYGTYLFKELIRMIDEELEFSIDYSNYKMIRIILNDCNGKELTRKNQLIYLVVPKPNK